MFVLKDVRVGQNGTLMSWIKRNTDFFMSRFIYLFISWFFFYFSFQITCFYALSPQTALSQTCNKNLQVLGIRLMGAKIKSNLQLFQRIVGVDQPTNLSGYSFQLDQPATSSREKGLELLLST